MKFGLMFFSAQGGCAADSYDFLLDVARFADSTDFTAIWTPERHFGEFGGVFPNPALTSAAIAAATTRIGIRAGSCILPLHNTVRAAEDWAMVDNLSRGRLGLAVGAGWNINDFVLYPERYEQRNEVLQTQLRELRTLWSGDSLQVASPAGGYQDVAILPRPYQRDVPLWVATSGRREAYRQAGAEGMGILTHMIGQDFPALERNISTYREARAAAGHAPNDRTVTVMLHTFVAPNEAEVLEYARDPFYQYIRSAVNRV